jgi:5-methylcytosine-specific restriction endonuclease McrA
MLPRSCLGCGTKIPSGSRCPRCARKAKTASRGYGAAWQRLARQAIRERPWCVDCGATADLTADHVVPIALGGQRLDPANVAVRCRSCNSRRGGTVRRVSDQRTGHDPRPAEIRDTHPVVPG